MISTALTNALLFMDAYNRGYGGGITLETILNTTQVGNHIIASQSEIVEGSNVRNAGFYALSYQNGDETIISYRGTDGFAKDSFYGFGIGAGLVSSAGTQQGDMALQFYNQVDDVTTNTLSTTGHSLGGGLVH